MADFSRDPKARLADSWAKHYVGVRLQQGVPILDADWNELEDLRRKELEEVGRWMFGNGVPAGSDGFRIAAIPNGGVNALVLKSKAVAFGLSSVVIDLTNSTAAAALGFDASNSSAARLGVSPAQITSNKNQPFGLANGQKLVVRVDNQAPQTVTFATAQFADIGHATAAEVAGAINGAIPSLAASAGTGNDFIVKGGDRTTANAGRLLVEGKMLLNEGDLKYTEQPLYQNPLLAQGWGVQPVPALTTPTATDLYNVYVDVWDRDVNSTEDPNFKDPQIGIETSIRVRREWAIRVAKASDFPGVLANKPAGHAYYTLAQLKRVMNNPAITTEMVADRRDTDFSLLRVIAYRANDGTIVVDTDRFSQLLVETRDNVREFLNYLTTKFVDPSAPYVAAEVVGMDALSSLAILADHGISLLNTQSMATRGALAFLGQLLDAEERLLSVWRTALFPLTKVGVHVYQAAYEQTLTRIESYLTGPAPSGFTCLADALASGSLFEAVRAQSRINLELGGEIDRPKGAVSVTYLGSITPTILKNQPFDLSYRVQGNLTPADSLDVAVFVATGWQATLKNKDGTLPFALTFGPGNDSEDFLVTVRSPNTDGAQSPLSLQVNAHRNPTGVLFLTGQKTLIVGNPPPLSEATYAFTIPLVNVTQVAGVFQVPTTLALANFTFRLTNNSTAQLTANMEYAPTTDPLWVITKGTFNMTGNIIAPAGQADFVFRFKPPTDVGKGLSFLLRARDANTGVVAAEIQITLATV